MANDQMPFTTVAQKPNQGTIPKTGCFRFRVAFFVSFLAKQKRKERINVYWLNNHTFQYII